MHYALIIILYLCILLTCTPSTASNDNVLVSPQWLSVTDKLRLAEQQNEMPLAAKQSKLIWLASNQWLTFDKAQLNSFIITTGTSHLAQQRLDTNRDLICQQSRCELPSVGFNRVVKITNHLDDSGTFKAMVGQNVRHRDSFRRALKLPREVTRIRYGQNEELLYHFKANDSVKLFFTNAKKLKITVRKDLTTKDINGKVYALINEQPSAIINVLPSRASEYKNHQIGLANSDYIAIDKGQYLTIKSETDAYIKVEQSHRAILDEHALDKQQERLFQPYWINNLQQVFEQVYKMHDLSVFEPYTQAQASPIAKRRYHDLLSILTSRDYLTPINDANTQPYQSQFSHFDSLRMMRLVDDTSYPVLSEEYAAVYNLNNQQQLFDLSLVQRVRPTITLHARSKVDTQMLVSSGQLQWHLILKKSANFATFELNVPLNAQQLIIQNLQNQRQNIEYVIQSDKLLDLPNSELLFAQPELLKNKSTVIKNLLAQQLRKTSGDYLTAIVPYKPNTQADTNSLSSMNWQRQLGEAQFLADKSPLQSLQILKKLVNVADEQIAIKAWQLRVHILNQEGRSILAKSYLEGLYKSSENEKIKQYAANALVFEYQSLQQDYKLQGLCASALTILDQCREILVSLAIKQQQNIMALWLSHDLDKNTTLESSFMGLNWRSRAHDNKQQPPYQFSHSGSKALVSANSRYSGYVVDKKSSLTFTATKEPLTISIRARSKSVQNGQYKMTWLYMQKHHDEKVLPIYSDISANTALQQSGERLSIASEAIISLEAGESVKIISDQTTYLTYKILPSELEKSFTYQDMSSKHYWQTPFMDLLFNPEVTMKSLLNNALFRLDQGSLSLNEYTQTLAKVSSLKLPQTLESLYSRVQSYGQWQPIEEYLDFAGTQLITVDSLNQASYSDQLSRTSSQESFNGGILLRPLHSLYIDLTQTRSEQIRLNFNFSSAELSQGNIANVAIKLNQTEKIWSVAPDKVTSFGFNKSELKDNILTLRWLNPYLSQTMTINAQEYRGGRWHTLPLPNKLLFYTVLREQSLIAPLPADRLVKMEEMQLVDNQHKVAQRVERTFFHPAGKIEVTSDKLKHVRLYTWQLSDTKQKISSYENTPLSYPDTIVYQSPAKAVQHEEVAEFTPEELSWQAFINYDQRGIFESSEDIPTRRNVDIGGRFRLTDDENWYRLDITYSLSEQDRETLSIDGYHSWQDHDSAWYVDSALQTTWQPSQQGIDSQYGINTYVDIGQIWRIDESHRHQWQVSPFYSYSSANVEDFLFDNKLNSDIYNFYQADHPHGWRAEYQYRYQPWVDNYLNFLVGSTSNDDWTSLDLLRFGASWNQFYQGHIFQAGLTSYYKFADDDRPISTWQYITSVGWRKQVHLGDFSQGWIKLRWDQDWFRNGHNISLEFSTGNLSETGLEVFSHDEIIFESLQLNHFLEQH